MKNTAFNHSVKVPKLYKVAAKIAQEVAEGGGSVKQLVYEKTHFNTKALYALVVTTIQKAKEIELLLKRTKLLENEPRLDPWLAKILISELIWGKKQLPKSEAKPILTILGYEQAFKAHLSDASEENATEKPYFRKPRYVRINTLITSFNEAVENFQDEGWNLQNLRDQNSYESFLDQVFELDSSSFIKDIHVKDMLVFPSGTEFYGHPGYKNGAIVLQDKASCLPVHILSPPEGSVVLDMCAAPGMKSTQLASVMNDQGTIYAVERDRKRFDILNKMVGASGSTCIKTVNRDVLECGEKDFPGVEYILVDPSCSGSGMTDRLEINRSSDNFRLQKLAGFQIKILRSALNRYPQAKRVVYSTCSLYPEENEDVVRQVLETNNTFKLVPADKFVNNSWKNYGSLEYGDIGKRCLYAKPEEDLTNGFFVAVFERLEEGENNDFYNGKVLQYRKKLDQKEARREKKLKNKNLNNPDGDSERISSAKPIDHNNLKETKNKHCDPHTDNLVTPSEAVSETEVILDDNTIKKKRKKNKHVQIDHNEEQVKLDDVIETWVEDQSEDMTKIKKHKKKRKQCDEDEVRTGDLQKKKKRKTKLSPSNEGVDEIVDLEAISENTSQSIKKKHKKAKHDTIDKESNSDCIEKSDENKKRHKKKRKSE